MTWRVVVSAAVVLALIALLLATLYLPRQTARVVPSASPVRSKVTRPPVGNRTSASAIVDAVAHPQSLHARPGGPIVGTLSTQTGFGSPRVVPVVSAVSGWLGVIAPQLRNGRIGWITAHGAALEQIPYSVRIETRSHRLTVFQNGRIVRTMPTGVGQPAAQTPPGRFAVTDKLNFHPLSLAYGCCALALSAHQPHLLPGWTGGDLVAIHSTPDVSSIGKSVSHGCVRVSMSQGRWLVDHIPLGTLVTVRAR